MTETNETAEDLIIVQSKVRDLVRKHELRIDGALIEALNRQVIQLVTAAVARAKGNDRRTLKPVDL